MKAKVELDPQVADFVRALAPEPRKRLREGLRGLEQEKDDLSLLAGMSAKERQKLRSKGIFTVTRLSYTFRPRRRPKRLRDRRDTDHQSYGWGSSIPTCAGTQAA